MGVRTFRTFQLSQNCYVLMIFATYFKTSSNGLWRTAIDGAETTMRESSPHTGGWRWSWEVWSRPLTTKLIDNHVLFLYSILLTKNPSVVSLGKYNGFQYFFRRGGGPGGVKNNLSNFRIKESFIESGHKKYT